MDEIDAARDLEGDRGRLSALRAKLETGLRTLAGGVVIFGDRMERVPNTTLFAVPCPVLVTTIVNVAVSPALIVCPSGVLTIVRLGA